MRLADRGRWCVALVDRSRATFHLGNEDGMSLSGTLDDEVHGQHRQGGWSYGRYQRSIENEVGAHLDHVAEALCAALREGRYDRLVLAGQQPIRRELEDKLDSPGSRCPACGFLGLHLAECPADGTELEQLPNVIEAAVALAYEQAAEVVLPAPAPELTAVEGIGAVTRF